MARKTEYILLLHTINIPQLQRQTSPQSKGLGKNFQSNGPKKQAGIAILISNKIDVKLKSIKRDKEEHFIFVTRKIHQKKISLLNVYGPNTRAPSYVKETLIKLKSHI